MCVVVVVSVAVVSIAAPVSIGAGAGAGAGAIVAVSAGTSPSSSAFAHAVAINAKAIMLAIPNLRIRTFLIREIRVFALIGNWKVAGGTCHEDYRGGGVRYVGGPVRQEALLWPSEDASA